jgi:predicted kinase
MAEPFAKRLYDSDEWQNLRMLLIVERGRKCERCGKRVMKAKELQAHHKIELTEKNVNDYTISMNPTNIELICLSCHNAEHNRFTARKERGVYIVYGMPLAGKETYVLQNKGKHDIVVNIDRLFEAVTMLPAYDKPNDLLPNIRAVYNVLIDNIKTRYGKWQSAWIVGGFANKYQREKMAADLGAELIFIDTPKDVCLARLDADEERRDRKDEYRQYIEKWCEEYMA